MEFVLFIAFIVLLAVVISTTSNLKNKLQVLEWDVSRLKELIGRVDDLEKDNVKKPALEKRTTEAVVATAPASLAKAQSTPSSAKQQIAASPTQPSVPVPPLTPEKPSRTREEWEAFVGGKLLNRIGAFALILGVGFFLKYAFDNNWISETVRVLIGAFAGLSCLLIAHRTQSKGLRIFAQGLVGAGISILYLSVYASFNFYHLVPQWVAFVFMSFVTAITLGQGLWYNSFAVVIFGWAGGFLTPIMLSTGEANETGLFTYIILLDIAIIAILIKKGTWEIVELLTLGATWLMYAAWHGEFYTSDKLALTVFFISAFWVLFFALDVVRTIRPAPKIPVLRHLVSFLNLAFFYSTLYIIVNNEHHEWMAAVTILIAAIYFTTAQVLKKRTDELEFTHAQSILTTVLLIVIATSIQFNNYTTIMFWSLEAAGIIWYGLRKKLPYVWRSALLLFLVAGMKLLATKGALAFLPLEEFKPLLNLRALAFLVGSVSLAAGAMLFRPSQHSSTSLILSWLQSAACVAFFIGISVELNDFFRLQQLNQTEVVQSMLSFTRFMSLSVLWTAYSLPFVWLGLRSNKNPLFISGLGALLLGVALASIRGIAFDPVNLFQPIVNVRAWAILLIAGTMVVQERILNTRRDANEWIPDVHRILRIALVLFILVLFTGETRDFFQKTLLSMRTSQDHQTLSDEILRLENLEQLSLSGVWLVYSVVLMIAGIWRKFSGFRIASIVLFGITILKIFIYDLSFLETLYRIFAFVGLGLILLGVSYMYQRFKHLVFADSTNPEK